MRWFHDAPSETGRSYCLDACRPFRRETKGDERPWCDGCPMTNEAAPLEENVPAIDLYLLCQSEWKLAPMGGTTGLDKCGVEATARMQQIQITPDVFERLKILESAALEVFREKREDDGETSGDSST